MTPNDPWEVRTSAQKGRTCEAQQRKIIVIKRAVLVGHPIQQGDQGESLVASTEVKSSLLSILLSLNTPQLLHPVLANTTEALKHDQITAPPLRIVRKGWGAQT